MKARISCFVRRLISDDSGQIFPWMVFLSVIVIGVAGLTIDLGNAYVSYRQLQATTDAAALAGAYELGVAGATTTTVTDEIDDYASASGGANAFPGLKGTSVTVTFKCISDSSLVEVPCAASNTGYNVVQVMQTTPVPTFFINMLKLFGLNPANTINMHATSTAVMESGQNQALNLAVVIDTTESMNDTDDDANCENTELHCALAGLQVLLNSLSPCTIGSTSSDCKGGYDQVSLFTFPNFQANEDSDDTSCPTSDPKISSYSYVPIPSTTNTTWTAPTGSNPTYQVTTFQDNYSATNAQNGGLSTSSSLGIADGASTASNCKGLQAPGGDGSYLAGAMYAAITALQAQAAANPNAKNALIVLTDGGMNSTKFGTGFSTTSGTYPSTVDQCQQTVAAGQFATSLGFTVYTVAYGASTAGGASQCTTDPSLSPCTELEEAASTPADFYSDATAEENNGQCVSADNPNLDLDGIFADIAHRFTAARLIPNSTT